MTCRLASFREGRQCPAGGGSAVRLVPTPATICRQLPALSPNPGAAHQPGVPEGHTAEVDPHVSSQNFPEAGRNHSRGHRRAGEATEERRGGRIFWRMFCVPPTGSRQSLTPPPVTAFGEGQPPLWENQEGIHLSEYYLQGVKFSLCNSPAPPKLEFSAAVSKAIVVSCTLPSG